MLFGGTGAIDKCGTWNIEVGIDLLKSYRHVRNLETLVSDAI